MNNKREDVRSVVTTYHPYVYMKNNDKGFTSPTSKRRVKWRKLEGNKRTTGTNKKGKTRKIGNT